MMENMMEKSWENIGTKDGGALLIILFGEFSTFSQWKHEWEIPVGKPHIESMCGDIPRVVGKHSTTLTWKFAPKVKG